MAARRIDVRIGARAVPVGELIVEAGRGRETSVFTYHESWRALDRAFALAPDMPLVSAPFYGRTEEQRSCLPLPLADTAPDSWGRKIIERLRGTQYLSELDYLRIPVKICACPGPIGASGLVDHRDVRIDLAFHEPAEHGA